MLFFYVCEIISLDRLYSGTNVNRAAAALRPGSCYGSAATFEEAKAKAVRLADIFIEAGYTGPPPKYTG